jgi:uncharacterized membrane protein
VSFEDLLRFTNVVVSGLAAGILVAVLVGMIPIIREAPNGSGLAIKQKLDLRIDRVNPPFWILSLLSGILVLVLVDGLSGTAIAFQVGGIAGSVGVGLITGVVNRPINAEMRGWSSASVPSEFPAVMARWSRMHAVRTLSGVIAFGCYAVATLAVID